MTMTRLRLTRRSSLLLPLLLAACGGETTPTRVFPPLRYDYLKPIDLSVRTIDIAVPYMPGRSTINEDAPVDPVGTLRTMAQDRLKPLGNAGRAVFTITDASLHEDGRTIRGRMAGTLAILGDDGQRLGYVEAAVTRDHTGSVEGRQQLLYDMVSGLMDDMNIELEHQIRTVLKPYLADEAPDALSPVPPPVEAAPLAAPPRH
jgi:hypothetical protein